jgi:hypothetical protein
VPQITGNIKSLNAFSHDKELPVLLLPLLNGQMPQI